MNKYKLIFTLALLISIPMIGNTDDAPPITYDPTHTPVSGYKEYITKHPQAPTNVKQVYKTTIFKNKSKLSKFFVIVNSSLYSSITSSINQYTTDLEAEGYTVNVYTWSGGTDITLKTFLQDSSSELVGVLFVGNLPIAWYELDEQPDPWQKYEDFPCDLYYMDLDGGWTDTNPTGSCQTGVWDGHSNGSGDIAPEIWIGRLYVSPSMGTESTLINKYFTKAHKYRMGGFNLQINNRTLEYIDDDFSSYWPNGFGTPRIYDSVVIVTNSSSTTAYDYENNRLTGNYAWINLAAHSNPTKHYFGSPTVDYNDVKSKKPLTHFYSLYCCSNCRFTSNNCMGNWYIFVDSCGLGATGSAKIGGMYAHSTFFSSLANYKTHGEALKDWWSFQLPCNETEKHYWYGLTLLGDPALIPKPLNNIPPNCPSTPSGPTIGLTDSSYYFSTSTTDANGDNISYRFAWGDGDTSTWTSYVTSGTIDSLSHFWSVADTYYVTAQAKDTSEATSGRSNTASINISATNTEEPYSTLLPTTFELSQSSPNPSSGKITISYAIPKSVHITLKVYDISGKLLKTLVNEIKKTARYSEIWDGKNEQGKKLAFGTYLVKFTAGNYTETRKIVLIK